MYLSRSEDDRPIPRLVDLDSWGLRGSILAALRERALPCMGGTLLDVGCGTQRYRAEVLRGGRVRRYVGLDVATELYGLEPDLRWDGKRIPLEDGAVDCALLTEVLEHCPDPGVVLGEVARVLKPGGVVFFTVPFLWPLHEVPNDDRRFTPFSLERVVLASGFSRTELWALGGWDSAMAQMLGLWVRRRPGLRPLRTLLSAAAWPFVVGLRALDRPPTAFSESTMVTGLAGLAWRAVD